jgi:hypothetical protein
MIKHIITLFYTYWLLTVPATCGKFSLNRIKKLYQGSDNENYAEITWIT